MKNNLGYFLFGIVFGIAICLGISLGVSIVSAYPYQLLENGTIVDLATGQNISGGQNVDIVYFNGSIYLVPYAVRTNLYQNFTIINQTFINNTNLTCYNCTYQNITNITLNSTGTFYTKSEVDSQISNVRSSIPANQDLSGYATRDYVNQTVSNKSSRDYISMSIGILALFLAASALWIIYGSQ